MCVPIYASNLIALIPVCTYLPVNRSVPYCTVLYGTVVYCTVQYYTVLYCTVLYVYCTVLYCTYSCPTVKF